MGRNTETNIQNECLLSVGSRPDVLAMRLQSGAYRAMDNPNRIIKVGAPGMPDTMLVVAVEITPDMVGQTMAVCAAAEIKTSTGRQSEAQKRWQSAFEKRGGVYRLVRSPADMLALIEQIKAGKALTK